MAKKSSESAAPYQPTATERSLMDEWVSADRQRVPVIELSQVSGTIATKVRHPEPTVGYIVLMDALGLKSSEHMKLFLDQAVRMARADQPIHAMQNEVNSILTLVAAQHPQDITEAMLCLQMAGIHLASANSLGTVRNSDNMETRFAAGQLANKLARTFTMQIDALKRFRTKGQPQKVVVEHKHIHVAPGAQAVFGDVTTGGGGSQKNNDQPHVRGLEHTRGEPIDVLQLGTVPETEAA